LAENDPDITDAGKLKTHNKQIAGNFRNYDIAVHQILSANKTYYACVEYCTPVLVMYEMEAEGKAGLSQEQKEAQLLVFHEVLQDILNRSEYKRHINLICYDDYSSKKQRLSELLVENILKSPDWYHAILALYYTTKECSTNHIDDLTAMMYLLEQYSYS